MKCITLGGFLKVGLPALIQLSLLGCDSADRSSIEETEIVRGLKTVLIENTENSITRRYPSVLQPAAVSSLSFEVGGKLGRIDLDVGQRIARDEVVATLDPESLELQVANEQAAVERARAASLNANQNAERMRTLAEKGTVSQSDAENAETEAVSAKTQLDQAIKALENAQNNLERSELRSPFNGIVNTVEVDSYANVSPGTPIVTVYADKGFEAAFSVNFETVSKLVVGTPARIRMADNPAIQLDAVVSELGSRADTVSSFPVVVSLKEVDPSIKAGMAVEVSMDFNLPAEAGFIIPLTATIKDGEGTERINAGGPSEMGVFVFDPGTSTVKRRSVTVAGVKESALLVIEGLSAGERVASAGVSFLRDGQKVKLLADSE